MSNHHNGYARFISVNQSEDQRLSMSQADLAKSYKADIPRALIFYPEKGEVTAYGRRLALWDPLLYHERIDEILAGTAEILAHVAWYQSGYKDFDAAIERSKGVSLKDVLKDFVYVDRYEGWGVAEYLVEDDQVPKVRMILSNPIVKTVIGSAVEIYTGYWAGVFSRYYGKRLLVKHKEYNKEKDQLRFLLAP